MDTKAQRKALFRSKLREAADKREKRIDSPLVRYNDSDQPICRVCNVILKSESLWPAHQASRKHHEAIESIKAAAAGQTHGNKRNIEPPVQLHKPQSSSTLPADFFDNRETKRQKNETGSGGRIPSISSPAASGLSDLSHKKKEISSTVGHSFEVQEAAEKTNALPGDHSVEMKERRENKPSSKLDQPSKKMDYGDAKQSKGVPPESFFDNNHRSEGQRSSQLSQAPRDVDNLEVTREKGASADRFFDNDESSENKQSNQLGQSLRKMDGSGSMQVKGALPEGFFDNKDADLRARGIEPVKVDINDAYKEFEKEIKDDLQEVDDRLEEEEIDAAEVRQEFESLEQRAYREKVEMVKQQLMKVKAARLARGQISPAFKGNESSDESESSSGGDDDDENFAVDWRAKHL